MLRRLRLGAANAGRGNSKKTFTRTFKKDIASQLHSRSGFLRTPMPSIDADLLFSRLNSFLLCLHKLRPPTLAAAARDIGQQDAASHLFLLAPIGIFGRNRHDQLIGALRNSSRPSINIAELPCTHDAAPASDGPPLSLCGGQRCSRPAAGGRWRQAPMMCSFCLQEWDFRKNLLPACGEKTKEFRLRGGQFPYIRVEACETCKVNIRTPDLTTQRECGSSGR